MIFRLAAAYPWPARKMATAVALIALESFPRMENKMIRTCTRRFLSTALSLLLVTASLQFEAGAQSAPPQSTGYSGQGAPLSADELQQLVAPIALYPDSLVAQILGAATFPDQVTAADNFLHINQNLAVSALMQAVNGEPWEPSVKALTQFPSVLDNLAKNLSWTSSLGEAYATQSAEVMSAVQVLRAKALAAGNLKSGSQIVVVQQSPQTIVIQSASPQVVYVPVYNPAVIYGYPYVTPGYSTAAVVTTGVLAFGAGIAVGAMMSGGCCAWGYSSWNCGWHGGTVVYGSTSYYGNSAWHGSSTSAYGAYGSAHYSSGYNSSTGTYARGGTVSNGYGSQSVGQAYNPKTGAYGQTEQGHNASGSWGSSTVSKNGTTAYSQHQTTSQGTTGQMHATNGASAYGASGKYNSAAAGQTANGNKYASANGTQYKNTGSGWQSDKGGSWNSVQKPSSSSSSAAHGYGGQEKSGGSSAFGGSSGGGWGSKSESSRGWSSRGGGGGWGGRR
jgi:hypothetical protein